MTATVVGSDGRCRCAWVTAAPDFQRYHDTEWGFPVKEDRHLFEKVCLEAFQCGLSWRTVLEKRENFRRAFCDFHIESVAAFGPVQIERMLTDSGLIRNRRKIEAAIHNARCAQDMIKEEGSLAAFFWRFEEPTNVEPATRTTSPRSHALSKALKSRGWKFVGPTTCYAFMQAMGLVNDHHPDCAVRGQVVSARRVFVKPD